MRLKIIIGFVFFTISYIAYGQQYESYLRSLSVNETSAILLEWMQPNDIVASDFVNYSVMHSDEKDGDYEILFEITTFSRTDYIHEVDNSTLDPHYYFISTHLNNGDSIVSDTLTHVRLKVSRYNSNSTARLSWNSIKDVPPLYEYSYNIHRVMRGGDEEIIAVTDENEYYDRSFHNCDTATITYFLTQIDPLSEKEARSTKDADIFQDITQPEIPNVKNVTVIDNSEIQIRWDPSPDEDVKEYRIYENRPPSDQWDWLFTVSGNDTTFAGENICDGEINYAVSAVDFCGNEAPPKYEFAHRVLDLEIIEPHICDQTVFFDWSDYINMDPPLQGYNIVEIDLNTGDTTRKATTTESEYNLKESFIDGKEYCFFVEAFNSSGYSSTSCTQCITGYIPISPDTLSVTNITVAAPGIIDVEWYIDENANESTLYRLFREDLSNGTQTSLREASPSEGPELFFRDENVNTDLERYRYFSETIDTCGNLMPYHPEATSLLLQGQSSVPGIYELNWSEAFNSSSLLQEYLVIRTMGNVIDTVYRGLDIAITDHIYDPYAASGEAEFVVVARFMDLNTSAEHYSFSNRITLSAELKMLNFPNAFSPNGDGLNETFGPINLMNEYNVSYYILNIFDRWGKKCYTTTSYSDGWDGTCSGSALPTGIYVYHAVLKTPQGSEFIQRGTVALIK